MSAFPVPRFLPNAGYGDTLREFIAAGGIKALVELARKEWPPNGRLSSSSVLTELQLGRFKLVFIVRSIVQCHLYFGAHDKLSLNL